jgi:hypothetical protein
VVASWCTRDLRYMSRRDWKVVIGLFTLDDKFMVQSPFAEATLNFNCVSCCNQTDANPTREGSKHNTSHAFPRMRSLSLTQ